MGFGCTRARLNGSLAHAQISPQPGIVQFCLQRIMRSCPLLHHTGGFPFPRWQTTSPALPVATISTAQTSQGPLWVPPEAQRRLFFRGTSFSGGFPVGVALKQSKKGTLQKMRASCRRNVVDWTMADGRQLWRCCFACLELLTSDAPAALHVEGRHVLELGSGLGLLGLATWREKTKRPGVGVVRFPY